MSRGLGDVYKRQVRQTDLAYPIGLDLNSMVKILLELESQYHQMNSYNFKKLTNLRITNKLLRIMTSKIMANKIMASKILRQQNRRRKLQLVVHIMPLIQKNHLIGHFQIILKNQERQTGTIVQNLKH